MPKNQEGKSGEPEAEESHPESTSVSLEAVRFLLFLDAEEDCREQDSYRNGTRMQGQSENKNGFSLLLIARRVYLGYLWCPVNERGVCARAPKLNMQ